MSTRGEDVRLEPSTVFVALTRPQMFAGVTYSYFIVNGMVAAELFLVFKSAWVLAIAITLHVVGAALCLREPRIFDLWIIRVSRTRRVANYKVWGCNSYRP